MTAPAWSVNRRAAETVCRHAADVDDARMLMEMLGLVEEGGDELLPDDSQVITSELLAIPLSGSTASRVSDEPPPRTSTAPAALRNLRPEPTQPVKAAKRPRTLTAELEELERTDPDVAAAAASYDRMVERITAKALPATPTSKKKDSAPMPTLEQEQTRAFLAGFAPDSADRHDTTPPPPAVPERSPAGGPPPVDVDPQARRVVRAPHLQRPRGPDLRPRRDPPVRRRPAPRRRHASRPRRLRRGPRRMTTYLEPFTYNATVTRVIDGDTIEVDVDHGFYIHQTPTPVRLLGCNAAEAGTPGGDAATANLTALLQPGTPVLLATAKPDKFAPRWDAAVGYRAPDGTLRDLVTDLIAQQWAAAWNGRGTKPVPPWPRTVTP